MTCRRAAAASSAGGLRFSRTLLTGIGQLADELDGGKAVLDALQSTTLVLAAITEERLPLLHLVCVVYL